MEKYIRESDAVQTVMEKPDMTPDEKAGIIRRLEAIPAADVVEVRHGWWHDVYLSSASSFVGTCSICGKSNDIPPVPLAKYCPNCGAKMDGGHDDG